MFLCYLPISCNPTNCIACRRLLTSLDMFFCIGIVIILYTQIFLRIISAAALVEKERSRRLGTSILNQVVREAIAFKPPPRTRGGKRGRVYYTTQVASNFLLNHSVYSS